jgi:hypothetical protein
VGYKEKEKMEDAKTPHSCPGAQRGIGKRLTFGDAAEERYCCASSRPPAMGMVGFTPFKHQSHAHHELKHSPSGIAPRIAPHSDRSALPYIQDQLTPPRRCLAL